MSSTAPDVTGLVLAGGGARGAYELGALRVLLPALEADGFPVRVLVGTSVGALNVAWLGANADVPAADRVDAGIALWQRFRFDDVVAPVVSKRSATTLLSYLSRAVFGRGARPAALLDPAPLTHTVDDLLDFAAVRRNVADGVVDAVAVAATSVHTGRTVVFHAGGAEPERDRARGIEYAATDLGADHVLASAAIPALFPSRQVDHPARAAGQYVDGGTRLNTPIKPALKLGATRIVVVGLNALWQGPDEPVAGQQPNDVFDGLAQILQALLAEPLAQDVQTLARRNELPTGEPAIPYVFVAPERPTTIGEIANDVFREHYGGFRHLLAGDVSGLGRAILAGETPWHGELLSYLFFAPEFAAALVAQGEADARAWLAARHEDGLFETTRRPPQTQDT